MRELRRKAVYAYQFIPLRRGSPPARHNFTVDTSATTHGFGGLPSAALSGRGYQFSVFSFRFFSLAWFAAIDGVGLARGSFATPGQTENRQPKTENC